MIEKHKDKWNNLANSTRYFIVIGGRGSGKSFEVGRYLTFQSFEKGQKILFTRYVMTSAHISVIPEFKEKISLLGLDDYFDVRKAEITNRKSATDIIFRGLKTSSGDQTANLKSLQGMTTWVMDEAEELTDEATFDKIDLSIRQKGVQNRIILILNPTLKSHWIYKRFFENRGIEDGFTGVVEDTTYIHSTYLDNIENLDESFLANIERLKNTDIDKFNHVILGGWLDKADGVIYRNWRFGEFDDSLPFSYSMDFGFFPDPDVLVKVAIDNSNKKLYVKEEFGCNGLTPSELKNKVAQIVGNSLVIADCAEPRLIEDIKRVGVNIVGVSKGANSIIEGIKLVQDYEIIVSHESTEIAKELNQYSEKNSVPIDKYNHRLDAIRYNAWHFRTRILPQGIKKSGFKR